MEALLCGLVLLAAAVALLARQLKFVGKDEQLFVEDLTELRAINGPATVFLPLLHKASRKAKALALRPLEYQVVTNSFDGSKRVEVGPQLLFLRPYDELEGDKQLAISLKATEFVRLLDAQTGAVRVEVGEQGKVVPGPYEAYLDSCGKRSAISLKCHEYVRIEDTMTGKTRVEQGEQLVFLTGHEEFVGAGKSQQVQQAVEIDEETAVLTRNKRDGQQALVTSKQVFVPRSDQEIIEVRKLIKLANHEACIVRGKDGTDQYFFGKNADQRAFFLPPYSELVELKWSRGRRRERRDLVLKKIDLRPMFMSFEFNCRTADNVELILEGTFFWEVVDLQAMFKTTCDTTGDVCNHARSKFIERVSKVTLQEFMRDFNKIAEMVHKEDDSFYSARGVLIHSLEVSGYRCAESSTALILEQIIQETTNRMNRLQQQESENEWQLLQIKGDIEEERAKKELLEVQIENSNARSSMEGLAEAQKVKSFLLGLADDVPDVERRIALWNVLRKKDALQEVCKNGARLYYTPNDVNLSIEDRTGPCVSETSSACKI
jgi:regulator of protease activity HflC (stomatin/prohibitin superfamily)